MATTPPAAAGPPVITPPLMQLRPPTWEELFAALDRVFALPDVPYGVLSTALFNSGDPHEVLLNKLEWMALESPMIIALVLDEDPDWITLVLKNPRRLVGSLVHPTLLDRLINGFLGPDAHTLAAIHIPASAFKFSAAYNVLDDAASIHLGLEARPPCRPDTPSVHQCGNPQHDKLCL